ncbi:MAG: hypothetical protein WAX69_10205 [Victivallales bacterium]
MSGVAESLGCDLIIVIDDQIKKLVIGIHHPIINSQIATKVYNKAVPADRL